MSERWGKCSACKGTGKKEFTFERLIKGTPNTTTVTQIGECFICQGQGYDGGAFRQSNSFDSFDSFDDGEKKIGDL